MSLLGLFKLIVLLPTVCLSLMCGIASSIDETRFHAHIDKNGSSKMEDTTNTMYLYNIIQFYGPLPGTGLILFTSEFRGRKPVFITLCVLFLLAAILSYVPAILPWDILGNYTVATLIGGVLPITTLVICEYCSPKHRFAFLIANGFMKMLGSRITYLLYTAEVISKESSYLSVYEMVIALVCLGSVYWWPESPYWLAGQGRYKESRNALLRLHKEGSEAQGELHALETSHRRPTPKLFRRALIIVLLTITVAKCASSGEQYLLSLTNEIHAITIREQLSYNTIHILATFVLSLIIVLISYKVSRKLIYVVVTVIPLALLFVVSIWAVSAQGHVPYPIFVYIILVCGILLQCGPYNLSLALFNEFNPQKYNTSLSCVASLYYVASSRFFSTIPLVLRVDRGVYEHGFLLAYALLALVAIIFLYRWLPETRGKNLLQIENLYMSRLYDRNSDQSQTVLEDS